MDELGKRRGAGVRPVARAHVHDDDESIGRPVNQPDPRAAHLYLRKASDPLKRTVVADTDLHSVRKAGKVAVGERVLVHAREEPVHRRAAHLEDGVEVACQRVGHDALVCLFQRPIDCDVVLQLLRGERLSVEDDFLDLANEGARYLKTSRIRHSARRRSGDPTRPARHRLRGVLAGRVTVDEQTNKPSRALRLYRQGNVSFGREAHHGGGLIEREHAERRQAYHPLLAPLA